MKNYKGKIKSIKNVAKDVFRLDIVSDVKMAHAGQFISVLCPDKTFRRPFSICDFENGVLSILIKLRGEGTQYLSSLKENDEIDFVAALGNGFDISQKTLLIGAGIGIAPMLFLKKELSQKNIENYLITGFRTNEDVIEGSDKNVVGGSVLDNIDEEIDNFKPQIIAACGPKIVLQKLSEIGKKHNIEVMCALEKVMACSIGVCRGCVIRIIENSQIKTKSVCKDGPVFRASEVIWN